MGRIDSIISPVHSTLFGFTIHMLNILVGESTKVVRAIN